MKKNQSGITLIALVITIIVLLILAGVSIAMLTGDNGLLTKSKQSVSDNTLAGAQDKVSTEIQAYMADFLEDKYSNSSFTETAGAGRTFVMTKIKAKYAAGTPNTSLGCDVAYDETAGTITLTKDKRQLIGTVDSDGVLSWDKIKDIT